MKKIIFLLSLIFFIFSINNSYWYWWCSSYWVMAIETYDWYCKCMSWYHFETNFLWKKTCERDKSCSEIYWWNTTTNLNWTCSCMSWYSFSKDTFWKDTCVSNNTLCQDEFWYNSIGNLDWTCSCKSWYWFKDKTYWWWKECVSLNTLCEDKFWYNSTYNWLADKCECSYWYDLKLKSWLNWNSYECTSCFWIYWLDSEYNSINKSCWCKDGYIIKDGKCELKSNSAYFFLSEYNDKDNTAIVISYYNKKKYLLELRFTSWLYKAEDFVWKSIVINMWTDFNIDKYDKFVLNNETKTTDIVSDILTVEEVDDNFSLKTCSDIYWENSEKTYNNKCICKNWYQWNYNQTSCELIPIKINTCSDTVNWFLGTDWKCYCNIWYSWNSIYSNCIKNFIPSQTAISTINVINNKNIEKANQIFDKLDKKTINLSNNDKINFYEKLLQTINSIQWKLKGDNLEIIYNLYLKIDKSKKDLIQN